jgi:hypothetical protein
MTACQKMNIWDSNISYCKTQQWGESFRVLAAYEKSVGLSLEKVKVVEYA